MILGLKKRQPNSGSFKKGHKPSTKSIQKQKGSWLKTIKANPEILKKIAKTGFKKGQKPWNKDKTEVYSKEILEKMSKGRKKHYAEHGSHRKGKHHLEISKQKNRLAHLGKPTWNKGIPISEEARMKQIRTRSTPEYRALASKRRSTYTIPKKDSKPEKILQAFCNSEGIKFQKHKWFNLGFQRAEVDLFIEPNICILADGDWSHANPNLIKFDGTMKYPPDCVIHPAYKRKPEETAMDRWIYDDMITKGLKKQNYKVLRFWEYDILNNPDIFRQKIIKIIKESRRKQKIIN